MGLVGAGRHGLCLGLFELPLAEAGAQLVQAVLCPDVVEARRACGHAGPCRSAGGRLVGERDDAVTAVTELKQEDGGDLMMYGYGRLSQTLLAHHLIDEIRFSIHPVLADRKAAGGGNGKTLPLKLLGATPAPNGVAALTYQPASR